jgi:hypothetical protein
MYGTDQPERAFFKCIFKGRNVFSNFYVDLTERKERREHTLTKAETSFMSLS